MNAEVNSGNCKTVGSHQTTLQGLLDAMPHHGNEV